MAEVTQEQLASMFHAPKLKHLACPLRTKDCNMIFGAGRKNHLRFGVNHNNNYYHEIAMIYLAPGKIISNQLPGYWAHCPRRCLPLIRTLSSVAKPPPSLLPWTQSQQWTRAPSANTWGQSSKHLTPQDSRTSGLQI